jgi:uncharacterized protein with HEPN domain
LQRVVEAALARITDHRRIIAFRNVLIHGYDALDDQIVWDAVTAKLPILKSEVEAMGSIDQVLGGEIVVERVRVSPPRDVKQ